jgi:hypothetical protein
MAPIKRKRGAAPLAARTRSATKANATGLTGTQNATKSEVSKRVKQNVGASSFVPSPLKAPHRSPPALGIEHKTSGMPTATTRRAVSLTSSLNSSTSKPSAGATLERNVDNVVLGDVLFRAWYPSRHVKEIVGREVVDEKEMLERLYVCKHCFKYSKELMGWVGHGKACERRRGGTAPMIPGRRIYSHGNRGWSVWEVDGEVDAVGAPNTIVTEN